MNNKKENKMTLQEIKRKLLKEASETEMPECAREWVKHTIKVLKDAKKIKGDA